MLIRIPQQPGSTSTILKSVQRVILLFMISAFVIPVFAQPIFPDDGELYRDDVVGRVDILIHPDTLQWIYDNPDSNTEWHATFIFNNGTVHDTVEDIGFRLRGNTSRYSAKKSFKVSFNTFESGRTYFGVEKMNLNGEHNDPTVARSKISWDLCRSMGIPASRSNYMRVYINNNYHGLYINVEHVDEEFVDSRFENQDGNLYKCLWPADLNYLGDDPDLYKYDQGGRRAYDLKTNEAGDDYSDLAHFIDVLNNTPTDDLTCELEKVFNVQDYLKAAAVDVFIANWDGYIWNKNNFYLYRNTKTGKFEYIPYDLDNTYGIDWFGEDWATRDIYDWENQGEYRPLYERLMEVQKYRDWFSFYLDSVMTIMDPDSFFTGLNEIRDQIHPYVQNDPYYPLDYGFTPEDFLNSYEEGLGMHVVYGIKNYITTRISSANQQINLNDIQPIVNYLEYYHEGPGTTMEVSAFAFDDEPGVTMVLAYDVNESGWEEMAMTAGENGQFYVEFEIPEGESTLSFRVIAEDDAGNTTPYPCDPVFLDFGPGGNYELYINEFLASNQTVNQDEYGEYDDWMELYNAGNEPVWLGDKYLTDDLGNPDKWLMPDYTIQPEEFLLFWCDEDQDQGPFHTNFKISADGEELGIFDNETTGFAVIETITFGEQQEDISYGRDPDAGENWIFYQSPTPGISNTLSSSAGPDNEAHIALVYPNPVKGNMFFLQEARNFRIISLTGQIVAGAENTRTFDAGSLQPGMYFIHTDKGEIIKLIKQ